MAAASKPGDGVTVESCRVTWVMLPTRWSVCPVSPVQSSRWLHLPPFRLSSNNIDVPETWQDANHRFPDVKGLTTREIDEAEVTGSGRLQVTRARRIDGPTTCQ